MTTPAPSPLSPESPQEGKPVDRRSRSIYACWVAALALIIALGAFFVAVWEREPLPLEASARANGLQLEVATAQREWGADSPINVSVTFTNLGGKPVVVLPHSCRLEFKGPDAKHFIYPRPPLPPWTKAQSLAPGQSMTVTFERLSVWEGIWSLGPGIYEVSAEMSVSEKTLKAPGWPDGWPVKWKKRAGQIWKGEIRAGPIGIVVKKP